MVESEKDGSLPSGMHQLLLALYSGPLEEKPFHTFLTHLREALSGNYATLLLRPPREGDMGVVLNAVLASSDAYTSYGETYFALDPFVDLPLGKVMTISEVLSPEMLEASEYYKRYMAPIDVHQIMGADLYDPEGMRARVRVTRSRRARKFSKADKALISVLLPHLQQAIRLHSRLIQTATEREIYEDAIDHLDVGTIILDESGRVHRTNQAARDILDTRAGLSLLEGRLQVGGRQENADFRRIVEEMMDAHRRQTPSLVRALRVERGYGRPSLGLVLRPAPLAEATEDQNSPSVTIFVSDPERRRTASSQVLMQLFGFTPAEATLSLLLANGLTLDEASRELHISRNTAKSHLSSIFSKTGVTRQTKLIQLILKSVAAMA